MWRSQNMAANFRISPYVIIPTHNTSEVISILFISSPSLQPFLLLLPHFLPHISPFRVPRYSRIQRKDDEAAKVVDGLYDSCFKAGKKGRGGGKEKERRGVRRWGGDICVSLLSLPFSIIFQIGMLAASPGRIIAVAVYDHQYHHREQQSMTTDTIKSSCKSRE